MHLSSEQRLSVTAAGYMELEGAKKDNDCIIVQVDGGVASHKGCCNLYKPIGMADEFRCGECRYLRTRQDADYSPPGKTSWHAR